MFLSFSLASQEVSRKDSVTTMITKERAWWDLLHYDINISLDIDKKIVEGKNTIKYRVIENFNMLQIDLQSPMKISSITQDGESLSYTKEFSAYFIKLIKKQNPGDIEAISITFEGSPTESLNPPWDGGFIWKKDQNQKPFIANANQSLGSSLWLPSKDIPYDEPDLGMQISITAPSGLKSVSNGRLIKHEKNENGEDTYIWKVINPINGYGININIGDYAHFSESYTGEKGSLNLDYYVLSYNLKKAKKHFNQVPKMLDAFEYWFGPYPFYEDGFKIVEVPYLGMEHQSSITYGNGYENGYLGGDLSGSGEGLKFDFIIIHESGHEWFANSLTNYTTASMWIHEGFTTYSEVLYLDYHFGKESGNKYLMGIRERIANNSPIAGKYEFEELGAEDMYWKGAAMIHTLRQVINDDGAFRSLLRSINNTFYHQTLSSEQLENHIMEVLQMDLKGFFEQYLRSTKIPLIQYKIKNGVMSYRFKEIVQGFSIPVKFLIDNEAVWLRPSKNWQEFELTNNDSQIGIDQNFYINLEMK